MEIILADSTTIAVNSIIPMSDGLVINVATTQLSEVEQQITPENIERITCKERDMTFAIYDNQQLKSLSKDDTGIHIETRYKILTAEIDVSKRLTNMQNSILQIKNDITAVQGMQDVQNAAIVEIGELISQNMASEENGEEETQYDSILCDDGEKQ